MSWLLSALICWAWSTVPDWSEGARVPRGGRANPYSLQGAELDRAITRGKLHALVYPVATTVLTPERPFREFLETPSKDPFKWLLQKGFHAVSPFHSMDQMQAWMGLPVYPSEDSSGVYSVPYPGGQRPAYRMGFSRVSRDGVTGFTFSCATCHSANLFGRTVLGLTNRITRANEYFLSGKEGASKIHENVFRFATDATTEEARMFDHLRETSVWADGKSPLALGLDTSLAQVALSLSLRAEDEFATKTGSRPGRGRPDPLRTRPADSKPAVWWTLKYKNRWLSDGSVVSGNPIFTNFLWNEIGRGAELHQLEGWLAQSEEIVRDLTTAVFATEPPRFTDFFPGSALSLESARRGEAHFRNRCSGCHGTYEKNWEAAVDPFKTVSVSYPEQTPVVDVGTDPLRWMGMSSLERPLNRLRISQQSGIVIRPQQGYVPPPLVGIWARFPYFHNSSAPSLCAVLTRGDQRPKRFYTGETASRATDFDPRCNGLPIGQATPDRWKRVVGALHDSAQPGMGNLGHDEGIFLKDGNELLSPAAKIDLIEYLKTL